ncbi:hypothetical protein TWF106_002363 [Orbilia oligospora]|uniref:Uncharacterized protein n=1 Tax=Orbilia oligospora TaxID=2813651 RepID=A0A7C8Q8Q3_ORBOL|nr:hypothetical protein TWF106_002363 [Orbilia oligospora]
MSANVIGPNCAAVAAVRTVLNTSAAYDGEPSCMIGEPYYRKYTASTGQTSQEVEIRPVRNIKSDLSNSTRKS